MEIASLVVAVFAVLAAAAAVHYAKGANTRADTANRNAEAALDLQLIVDKRQREFRAVEWAAEVEKDERGEWTLFKLTNSGDTDAESVTVVLDLHPGRETLPLGSIPRKSSVTVSSVALHGWMREAYDEEVIRPGFRLHWSSPLGQVSDETRPLFTVSDSIEERRLI